MTEPPRLGTTEARASQALIDAYAEAWQRIEDAQQTLIDDPLNARKRARLNELADMVGREIATLDEEARIYVQEHFPNVYGNAVAAAANAVAPGQAAFVAVNQEAAARLATGLYTELLEATAHVDATTKQLIRRIGRDAALRTAIDGRTAKQAALEMRRILNQNAIHAVTYANGARMGLKGYTEMAIRTTTALALNEGTLQGSADAGCLYWEVFDGPTCGWTYHDDPELANGKVVGRDDALAYPISHPNCRRAVGPRPDLGVDNAAQGRRSTTPEQDQAQIEADEARGRPVRRELERRAGRARRGVVPRAPRKGPERSEARVQAALARRDLPSQRKAAAAARGPKTFQEMMQEAAERNPLPKRAPAAPPAPPAPRPAPTLLERYADGEGVTARQALGGGQMARRVELLTFKDGTRAVLKETELAQEAASEVAYSRVARQLGAKAPRAERIDDRTLLMDYVEDRRDPDRYGLVDWSETDDVLAAYESESGRRLGLVDAVMQHQDRHSLNWMIDADGDVVGIDNALQFVETGGMPHSPFALRTGLYRGREFGQITDWLDNDYTAADWERVRAAVRSVEAELREVPVGPIARYGADPPADGFEAIMRRVESMASRARGASDRIVGDA